MKAPESHLETNPKYDEGHDDKRRRVDYVSINSTSGSEKDGMEEFSPSRLQIKARENGAILSSSGGMRMPLPNRMLSFKMA